MPKRKPIISSRERARMNVAGARIERVGQRSNEETFTPTDDFEVQVEPVIVYEEKHFEAKPKPHVSHPDLRRLAQEVRDGIQNSAHDNELVRNPDIKPDMVYDAILHGIRDWGASFSPSKER